jgi:hypothetical protein
MSYAAPFRGLATRLGVGGVARRYYHEPLANLRAMLLEGGPFEQRRTERGRLDMIAAARTLAPLQPPTSTDSLEVCFLSGLRYWYQTLFCIYSLQRCTDIRVDPTIYDDGSFTDEAVAAIVRVVPWTKFVLGDEIEAQLDAFLPVSRFPTLRARRLRYLHLRKLCDIHLCRQGWTIVLDSDMLFFQRPIVLLDWAKFPRRPCHLIDVGRAYGYTPELMRELADYPEAEHVNVGLTGLCSEMIDWPKLEYWCRIMLEREGESYLQEQALIALLLAGQDCLRLPVEDYQVLPSLAEGRNPTAVLHHYVSYSKRSYYQWGWRRVLDGDTIEGSA